MSARRPNLVVFLPDQQRADTITPKYTPKLASLAEHSVVFERTYVTHPVCTPSRSAIMTGTWPHQNGCTRNNIALPAHFKCLPELVDTSYSSAYFGKWHLGNEAQPQRGFQHRISTEGISDYSRFLTSHGIKPDRVNDTFSPRFISKLPIELSRTRFLEKHACDFIEKHAGKPFILFVAFVEPHSPYNGPLNEIHSADEIEVLPRAELGGDAPLRYRLMREWQESEALLDRERLPEQYYFGITPEEYRGMRQRYLGLVTQIDQSIGRILEQLRANNLYETSIVVHTSDHGDMLGAHHLFGKEVMFEQAVRVPWIIKLPAHQSSRRIAKPVSQIDFLPTLVELLGGERSSQLAGKPLLSRASKLTTLGGDPVFIEWAPNRVKAPRKTKLASRWKMKRVVNESTRAIVSSEWKLCLRNRDLNELYNLADDPEEIRNLYSEPGQRDVISKLTEQIHWWQETTGDKLRI